MSSAQPFAGNGFSSVTTAMNIRKKAIEPPAFSCAEASAMPSMLSVPVAW